MNLKQKGSFPASLIDCSPRHSLLLAEIHVINTTEPPHEFVCFTPMHQMISVDIRHLLPLKDNGITFKWSQLKHGYTIAILYPFKEGIKNKNDHEGNWLCKFYYNTLKYFTF